MSHSIGGAVPKKFGSSRMPDGRVVSEGVGPLEYILIDFFFPMLLMRYLQVFLSIEMDILHEIVNTGSTKCLQKFLLSYFYRRMILNMTVQKLQPTNFTDTC